MVLIISFNVKSESKYGKSGAIARKDLGDATSGHRVV